MIRRILERLTRLNRKRKAREAVEVWQLQASEIKLNFLSLIATSQLNPNLRTRDCEWTEEVAFAYERDSGLISAFAGVVLLFESDADGEFESETNLALPRDAVAVFFYRNGLWEWSGRTLFNMDPPVALKRFEKQFDEISITSD